MRVGSIGAVALLKQKTRPLRIPADVRAIGYDRVGQRERSAKRQIAADIMVDGDLRVSSHVDWGDAAALALRIHSPVVDRNGLPMPGVPEPVKIEPEHHADVEQGLVADRAAAKQVLDGLLVAVGSIGKLGLRQLLLDHRRLDLVEGLGAGRDGAGDGLLFHGSRRQVNGEKAVA